MSLAGRVVREAETTTPAVDVDAIKKKVQDGIDSLQESIGELFTKENIDVSSLICSRRIDERGKKLNLNWIYESQQRAIAHVKDTGDKLKDLASDAGQKIKDTASNIGGVFTTTESTLQSLVPKTK